MEQRQPVAQQLAVHLTSIALVVSAAGLVRSLFRLLSSARRGPEASGDSQGGSSGAAIVSVANRGNGTGVLVAAVVGAAIGAGVALLCAPRSGRESREWIAQRTRGPKDRLGVVFGQREHPPRILPMSR